MNTFIPSVADDLRSTEESLWELSQQFEDEPLMNLILVHNIVANMKREDFDAARYTTIGHRVLILMLC